MLLWNFLLLGLGWADSAAYIIAAEATSSPPDWVSALLQGGPFAIVLILLILDKISLPGERNRLIQENEQLRQDVKVLNENIINEIVPTLVKMNALMSDVVEELDAKRGSRG